MNPTNGEARGARTPRASEAETEDIHSILRPSRHVKGCAEDCARCDEDCISRRVEGPAEEAWRMSFEANDEEVST